ncbi:hypothetical protein J0H33_12170 [bacterium]|nr:hypothetical protein [bacterium]
MAAVVIGLAASAYAVMSLGAAFRRYPPRSGALARFSALNTSRYDANSPVD